MCTLVIDVWTARFRIHRHGRSGLFQRKMVHIYYLFLILGYAFADPCKTLCKCWEPKVVYCNGTGISQVPQGLPPDTDTLYLSRNSIRNISKSDLKGLLKLKTLDLSGNGLQEGDIEDGALELPLLNQIGLSSNNFVSIPKILPKKLFSLSFIDNKIVTLPTDSFVDYPYLAYLELSFNAISKIQENAFDPLTNLLTLDISFNNLTDEGLPSNPFFKNSRLNILKMRFNRLEHIVGNLPPSLQHLDFVGNPIKRVPSYAFRNLNQLDTLELWQSKVTTLDDDAFTGLVNLTILDLMEAQVVNITKDTFNGLRKLKTLYLSGNKIDTIAPTAFEQLGNVTSLWLDGNQLSTLDPEVLDIKFMPHLQEVYVDANPWFCDCHLKWLRELIDNAPFDLDYYPVLPCTGPPKVAGKTFDTLKPGEFVCP